VTEPVTHGTFQGWGHRDQGAARVRLVILLASVARLTSRLLSTRCALRSLSVTDSQARR